MREGGWAHAVAPVRRALWLSGGWECHRLSPDHTLDTVSLWWRHRAGHVHAHARSWALGHSGGPRPIDTRLHPLPLSSHGLFMGTPAVGTGATWRPHSRLIVCKALFTNEVPVTVPGVGTSASLSEGTRSFVPPRECVSTRRISPASTARSFTVPLGRVSQTPWPQNSAPWCQTGRRRHHRVTEPQRDVRWPAWSTRAESDGSTFLSSFLSQKTRGPGAEGPVLGQDTRRPHAPESSPFPSAPRKGASELGR